MEFEIRDVFQARASNLTEQISSNENSFKNMDSGNIFYFI